MPFNMSFALTIPQFVARQKTVTRRLGWKRLRKGQKVMACKKCMGLKKGETLERLHLIEILRVTRERLDQITQPDVIREGFPGMSPKDFIAMFCEHNGCRPDTVVTRIEFKHLSD